MPVDLDQVETNFVLVDVGALGLGADDAVARLRAEGVLLSFAVAQRRPPGRDPPRRLGRRRRAGDRAHPTRAHRCAGRATAPRLLRRRTEAASYSYWSARRTLSFAARRAGQIAARIPTITAMKAKTTSWPHGISKRTSNSCSACVTRAASKTPSGSPSAAPMSAVIDALLPHHPPGLAAGSSRPRAASRARASARRREDERVDHPEDADDHGEREQDVQHHQELVEVLVLLRRSTPPASAPWHRGSRRRPPRATRSSPRRVAGDVHELNWFRGRS